MKKAFLNLDKKFNPFYYPHPMVPSVNELEIEFELFKFNGGELNIRIEQNMDFSRIDSVVISQRIRSSDDLFAILIAKEALVRLGVEKFELFIPYVPYARQDRVCNHGESFTLRVFANILNTAGFKNVYCFDAHSEVSPAIIDNCININNHRFVQESIKSIVMRKSTAEKDLRHNINIISPDSGSNKKIKDVMRFLTALTLGEVEDIVLQIAPIINYNLIKCDKTRDLKTGDLTGFDVYADDLKGIDCVIVDDIVSNGGTFLGLAEELKRKNAGDLYLVCSHGEFGADPSKTIEKLSSVFKKIYVTDSFQDISNENVTQLHISNMPLF